MTPDQHQQHAAKIMLSHARDVETLSIWEHFDHPGQAEPTDTDVDTIRNLIRTAQITIDWPTCTPPVATATSAPTTTPTSTTTTTRTPTVPERPIDRLIARTRVGRIAFLAGIWPVTWTADRLHLDRRPPASLRAALRWAWTGNDEHLPAIRTTTEETTDVH